MSGGFGKEKAEQVLQEGKGVLTTFGCPPISNPDLVNLLKNDISLTETGFDTFYTPSEKGYAYY